MMFTNIDADGMDEASSTRLVTRVTQRSTTSVTAAATARYTTFHTIAVQSIEASR